MLPFFYSKKEGKMKKSISIKKTATERNGSKWLEIAAKGPIAADVKIEANQSGKLIAYIDDEAIGRVQMSEYELPEVYEVRITGVDPDTPNTFLAEMDVATTTKKAGSGSFSEMIDDIISKGIASKEDIEERVQIMQENDVKKSVISAALEDYASFDAPVVKPSAIYQNARADGEESILNQALIAALTQSALIFSGEKSTGKNVCAETLAYVLGRPYYRINFERDMLLEDVFGSKTTDNSAAEKLELELAKAKIKVELASDKASDEDFEKAAMFELFKAQSASIRLVQATSDIIRWAKEGGVMMFDEVNMANANILQAVMNSAADGEKTLIVPGVENIKLHDKCVLLAGMNPGYAGTMELNTATKSRCGFINFDFPETIKAQLKANFSEGTPLKEKQFAICDDLYKDFKAAVDQGRVTNDCINIRGFVNALKAVERFPDATSLATQIEIFVINGCNEDDRVVLSADLRNKI